MASLSIFYFFPRTPWVASYVLDVFVPFSLVLRTKGVLIIRETLVIFCFQLIQVSVVSKLRVMWVGLLCCSSSAQGEKWKKKEEHDAYLVVQSPLFLVKRKGHSDDGVKIDRPLIKLLLHLCTVEGGYFFFFFSIDVLLSNRKVRIWHSPLSLAHLFFLLNCTIDIWRPFHTRPHTICAAIFFLSLFVFIFFTWAGNRNQKDG